MTLQLKVGGKYKTRNGGCVTITPTTGHRVFVWQGNNGHTYMDNGRWLYSMEYGLDLVSEVLPDTTTPVYLYPGALVRLRDGSKARIYATDGTSDYPIHGQVNGHACVWNSQGTVAAYSDHALDIVGPWVEPPVKLVWWSVYDSHGNYYIGYAEQSNAEQTAARIGGTAVKLTGTLPTRDK